jgi:hypothetical protein
MDSTIGVVQMKILDVKERLDCALAGVGVLRALQSRGEKMTYQEFAKAIGLMPRTDPWSAWYRTQTTNILIIIAATEKFGGRGNTPLKFENIVGGGGKPGAGFAKTSQIKRS